MSGRSLVVNNIRQQQFGIYTCKVDKKTVTYKVLRLQGESFQLFNSVHLKTPNTSTAKEKQPALHPFAPPPPPVSAEPPSLLLPGQTVTLVCEAERPDGRQEPEIHWLNPRGEKVTQATHSLKVASRHGGRWTCVVTLGGTRDTAQISLTVVGG